MILKSVQDMVTVQMLIYVYAKKDIMEESVNMKKLCVMVIINLMKMYVQKMDNV